MSRKNHISFGTLIAVTIVFLSLWFAINPLIATADDSTALMQRVERALRANTNLNGAKCYTAAPGVIVLYGRVFDEKDRTLAETTAQGVPGVTQVVNSLRTKTGKWRNEEDQINNALESNGFGDVSARVIGNQVYLAGTVTSDADKQRASSVVTSVSNLQQNNMIWVKPAAIF